LTIVTTWTRTLTLAALLAGAPAALAGGEKAKPIAVVHGTIVDGRGGPPIPDGTIVLRGTRIEAVGRARDVAVPRDATIIEARGMSVLPGLADLHVHLTGGWDGVNIDFLSYQRYLDALLYAGVTTVLDTGNSQPWILQLRQESARGRLLAPHIYCTGAMIDGADPAWPDLAYSLSSAAQVPALVKRDKDAGVDLIKGYANLSVRLLQRLAEEAARQGLRVVVDQWDRNGSPDVAEAGIAGFAHLPTRVMSPEDVRVLKTRAVFVITTLAVDESFARTRFGDLGYVREPLIADTTPLWVLDDLRADAAGPLSDAKTRALEGYRRDFAEAKRNARALRDAGILLGAGTDAPYPGLFQGEGIHRELELLVEAGLTPLEAIRAATYDAARILKAETVWGSLQPGLRGDLLVVRGQPASAISDTRKVEMVILEGRILDRPSLRFDPARGPGFRAVPGVFVE